jgi:hypothetical protein
VPSTSNYKYDPPKEVKLAALPLTLYDFPTDLLFLQKHAGATIKGPQQSSAAPKPPHNIYANAGVTAATFGRPAAAFASLPLDDKLSAGCEHKVDPTPVFKQCGFYSEARRTGGANYDNALWMYSILGTIFMENGNAIAHELSKGHANYTAAETQAMYDRKVADGIGYPSCAAIAGAGCASCATCPHFGKITSPLKLGAMGPKPDQGGGTPQQTPNAGEESTAGADEWPDCYSRGGAPVKGYANTLAAFHKLGIKFTLDTFRQKEFSEGHEIELLNGELSDRTVTMLRDQISRECLFYPDKEIAREAITAECYRNRINPVTDYFDGLKWDGVVRLPTLLHEYLGAEDTALNAAIGKNFSRNAAKPPTSQSAFTSAIRFLTAIT